MLHNDSCLWLFNLSLWSTLRNRENIHCTIGILSRWSDLKRYYTLLEINESWSSGERGICVEHWESLHFLEYLGWFYWNTTEWTVTHIGLSQKDFYHLICIFVTCPLLGFKGTVILYLCLWFTPYTIVGDGKKRGIIYGSTVLFSNFIFCNAQRVWRYIEL